MKKTLTAIIILAVIVCIPLVAASADWESGYRQGYADALAGKPNALDQATTTSSTPAASMGVWTVGNYVDEFGDETGDHFITQNEVQYGTFSNSVTYGEDLLWDIRVDTYSVDFFLYEYGSYSVGGYGSYRLSVRDESGNTHTFNLETGDNFLYTNWKDTPQMISLLKTERPLRLVINQTEYGSSKYNLGTLETSGFNTVYNQIAL